jgi:plastocyanin
MKRVPIVLLSAAFLITGTGAIAAPLAADRPASPTATHVVNVPEADKFVPFALQIHAGESVTWVNGDTDDHTVVSDAAFDTTGPTSLNQLIPGTDSNGGKPGMFKLTFDKPGMFVYFCRFHSHLDADDQPIAPGPDGGIQDAQGNFGTPMMGVITVLPGRHHEHDNEHDND